ncbi:hypothetical protein BCR44DRAFT_1433892 [Catenaria anguillulae PL171]|uniref:Secreted protein n=1 Tax=Catenaria anguillulae PL171 TaxID=765915 RepID=A0A1Y2HM28_9FUNG|nr:hypothetical protein BCR44DRAFT_1433892 [Catenaria anguillulae PL171]
MQGNSLDPARLLLLLLLLLIRRRFSTATLAHARSVHHIVDFAGRNRDWEQELLFGACQACEPARFDNAHGNVPLEN